MGEPAPRIRRAGTALVDQVSGIQFQDRVSGRDSPAAGLAVHSLTLLALALALLVIRQVCYRLVFVPLADPRNRISTLGLLGYGGLYTSRSICSSSTTPSVCRASFVCTSCRSFRTRGRCSRNQRGCIVFGRRSRNRACWISRIASFRFRNLFFLSSWDAQHAGSVTAAAFEASPSLRGIVYSAVWQSRVEFRGRLTASLDFVSAPRGSHHHGCWKGTRGCNGRLPSLPGKSTVPRAALRFLPL